MVTIYLIKKSITSVIIRIHGHADSIYLYFLIVLTMYIIKIIPTGTQLTVPLILRPKTQASLMVFLIFPLVNALRWVDIIYLTVHPPNSHFSLPFIFQVFAGAEK